jgi:nucleotide sugar dehydrogenase
MTNVCVIGLGKIGLPLALLLAKAGHRVMAVDADAGTLHNIRNGSLNSSKNEKALLEQFLDKRLFPTRDLREALSESEVVFIAIGTGICPDGTPDLSNLYGLFENICVDPQEVKGKTFVLKSTLPVGTTRKIATFIEEKMGLRCGVDFFLVFCPERVLGDKAISEMASLPKIIGGMDRVSSEKAAHVYGTIGGKLIIVDSPEIAELIKLTDNAYRQTLFAFANDLALLATQYGINAYELIRAANDSYPRNNIPSPSAGVSGYCLTKDPLYLEVAFKEIASKRGFSSVWFSARKTNDYMPVHMMDLLKQKLLGVGKDIKGSNILVCGITYKENTDDIRYSHGLEIAARLSKEGANVFLWDPHVQKRDLKFQVVENPKEILEVLDALVFTVKHDEFMQLNVDDAIELMLTKMRTPILVDGWGVFQKLIGRKGVYYAGVGIVG